MHSYCSSQTPNFKIDRFPKSKYDVGGGLCKVPERKRSFKKCRGGCSCDIDTYMLHLSDQLPHGATKLQKRLKAKHDAAKNLNSNTSCVTNSTEESEPTRKFGGGERSQTEKVEESCAEFLSIVQDSVLDTISKCMKSVLKESLERVEHKVDIICSHLASNSDSLDELSIDFKKQMNNMNLKNDVRFKCLCEFLFEHVGNKVPEEQTNNENLKEEHDVDGISATSSVKCPKTGAKMCICKHIKTEFVDVVPTLPANNSTLMSPKTADNLTEDLSQHETSQRRRSNSVESANNLKERLENIKANRALRESLNKNENLNEGQPSRNTEESTSKCCCFKSAPDVSLCCCSKKAREKQKANELSHRRTSRRDSKEQNDAPSSSFGTKEQNDEPSSSFGTKEQNDAPQEQNDEISPKEQNNSSACGCFSKEQNNSNNDCVSKKNESRASINRSIKFNASISTCCQRNKDATTGTEHFCCCKPFANIQFENDNSKRSLGGFCNSNAEPILDLEKKRTKRWVEYSKVDKSGSGLGTDISQDNTADLLSFCVRERKRRQQRLTSSYNTPYLQVNASNQLYERTLVSTQKSSAIISSPTEQI